MNSGEAAERRDASIDGYRLSDRQDAPTKLPDILALNEHTASLDAPLDLDPGQQSARSVVRRPRASRRMPEVQHRELETLTRAWLARLSDKHRHVIERRFGLNHIEPATLEELADEMGLHARACAPDPTGSARAVKALLRL